MSNKHKNNISIMENSKFKVGDKVLHRMEMFDSFITHHATILRLFKNGKVRITFKTWTGAVNKINVEAKELKHAKAI